MALLAALRGNIIVYQGEELGLEQDDIPFELLKDPEAIANWPLTLSRDGARTPMPWRNQPLGEFTTGDPWLPLSPANLARAVAEQEDDAASLLNLTRSLLSLRNSHPALRLGALENCRTEGALLSFMRIAGGERIACRFNLGPDPVETPGNAEGRTVLMQVNEAEPARMQGYSALFLLAD